MTSTYAPLPHTVFSPTRPAPIAPAPVPIAARDRVAARPVPMSRPVPMAKVYRRRRLVVLAAVAIVIGSVLGLVSFVGSADATPTAEGRAAEAVVVVVESGDTLWSIAQDLAPDTDPREMVHRLSDLVPSSTLQPGQEIVVPGYWIASS